MKRFLQYGDSNKLGIFKVVLCGLLLFGFNQVTGQTIDDITLDGTPAANATSVDYTVDFSTDPTTLVTAASFSVANVTGTLTASTIGIPVVDAGADKSIWHVNISGITGTGSFRLVLDDLGTINPAPTNPLPFNTGDIHTGDVDPPTVSSISIGSDNSTSSSYATSGDVVTLSFESNEPLIGDPVVVFLSGAAAINDGSITYDNPSGNLWTAKYTANSSDTEGAVTFTLDYTDAAGNPGAQENSVDDASSVTFDKTDPTLSTISITSDNGTNSNYATTGDIITLSFESNEPLGANPTVEFKTNGSAITDVTIDYNNPTGNEWTAEYTANVSDNDGAVTFKINYIDNAGRSGAEESTTDDASSVTFDKTKPTLSNVGIASDNGTNTSFATSGDIITLSFESDETLSANPVVVFLSGGAAINDVTIDYNNPTGNEWTAEYTSNASDTEGPVTFTIDYVDNAGNAGDQENSVDDGSSVTFDKTAPVLSSISIQSDNGEDNTGAKASDDVTLSFESSDELVADPVVVFLSGGAAINDVTITYDNPSGNLWTAEYTANSADTEGTVTFTINYDNQVGLSGTPETTTDDASTMRFDNTGPQFLAGGSFQVDDGDEGWLFVEFDEGAYGDQFTPREGLSTGDFTIIDNDVPSSGINFDIEEVKTTNDGGATYTVTPVGGETKFRIKIHEDNHQAYTSGTIVSVRVVNDRVYDILGAESPALQESDNITLTDNVGPSVLSSVLDAGNTYIDIEFDEAIYSTSGPSGGLTTGSFDLDFTQNPGGTATGITATDVKTTGNGGVTYAVTPVGGETMFRITFTLTNPPASGAEEVIVKPLNDASWYDTDNNATLKADIIDPVVTLNDLLAPTLSPVLLKSNNTNPLLAKIGDVITLSFTASETLDGSTSVTFLSGGAAITNSPGAVTNVGLDYEVSYTTHDSDSDGPVTFTLNYADVAGNPGVPETTTSDALGVTFDGTNPTISSITFDTDPVYESAKTQTISVLFNEDMDTNPGNYPAINVSGSNWETQTDIGWLGDNRTFQASFTHDGTEEEITVTVTVPVSSGAIDVAGNTNDASIGTYTFEVDTQQPAATLTYSDTDPYPDEVDSEYYFRLGQIVTITATFDEPLASTPKIALSGPGTNNLTATDMVPDGTNPTTIFHYDYTMGNSDGQINASLSIATDVVGNLVKPTPTDNDFYVDNTLPQLDGTTPYTPASSTFPESSNLPLNQIFTITFDEKVFGTGTSNVNTKIVGGADNFLDGSTIQPSYAIGASFTPTLLEAQEYEILISTGAFVDRAGNVFQGFDGVPVSDPWDGLTSFGDPTIDPILVSLCVEQPHTLTGKFLTGVSKITFLGTPAAGDEVIVTSFTIDDDENITLTVPDLALTGDIEFVKENAAVNPVGAPANGSTKTVVSPSIVGPSQADIIFDLSGNGNVVCSEGEFTTGILFDIRGGTGPYKVTYTDGVNTIGPITYNTGQVIDVDPPNAGLNTFTILNVEDDNFCDIPSLPGRLNSNTITEIVTTHILIDPVTTPQNPVCLSSVGGTIDLTGTVTGDNNNVRWSTLNGTGTFVGGTIVLDQNTATPSATYNFTPQDYALDELQFTLESIGSTSPCSEETAQLDVTFTLNRSVDLGGDIEICNDPVNPNVVPLTGLLGGDADRGYWEAISFPANPSTGGNGTWTYGPGSAGSEILDGDDGMVDVKMDNSYTLSAQDIQNGGVTIRLTPAGGSCGSPIFGEIDVIVNFIPAPTIISQADTDFNGNPDHELCSGDETVIYEATNPFGSTFSWSVIDALDGTSGTIISGQGNNKIIVDWDESSTTETEKFAVDEINNLILIPGHSYIPDQQIELISDGTLPVGLSGNTYYWIINVNTNDFQISLTPGGPVVDIIDQGTGVPAEYTLINNIRQLAQVEVIETDLNGCVSLPVLIDVFIHPKPNPIIVEPTATVISTSSPNIALVGGRKFGTSFNPADGNTFEITPGVFSGPGVVQDQSNNYQFDADIAGLGMHDIIFNTTDANGCSNSITQQFTVFEGSEDLHIVGGAPLEFLAEEYCEDNGLVFIELSSSAIARIIPGWSFDKFTGPGITDTGGGTATYDPQEAANITGGGAALIQYTQFIHYFFPPFFDFTFYEPLGSTTTNVNLLPELVHIPISAAYCNDELPIDLLRNPITNPEVTFSFSVVETDVGGVITSGDPNGLITGDVITGFKLNPANEVFAPDDYTPHLVTYEYSYQNAIGCSDTKQFLVTINRLPPAPASPDVEACEGEDTGILTVVNPVTNANIRWYDNALLTGAPFIGTIFTPVITQDVTFFYVTQEINGCESPFTEVRVEIFPLPDVDMVGFNDPTLAEYCAGDAAFLLTLTPVTGGVFTGDTDGVVDNGDGTFSYDPLLAIGGTNNIQEPQDLTLIYSTEITATGCVKEVIQDIKINPTSFVQILNLQDLQEFCVDESDYELTPNISTGSEGTGTFTGNGIISGNVFSATVAGVGTHPITYTFINNNGCVDFETLDVVVNPLPLPSYDVGIVCAEQAAQFTSTTPGNIVEWQWKFNDANATSIDNESTLENPVHAFSIAGVYNVDLTVVDDQGCQATFTSAITVGEIPQTSFDFEAIAEQKESFFTNTTPALTNSVTAEVKWTFLEEDGSLIDEVIITDPAEIAANETVSYTFTTVGVKKVILEITTDRGCIATAETNFFTVPFVNQNEAITYFEDFEDADNGWVSWGFDNPNSEWVYGTTDGIFEDVNKGNYWYTDPNSDIDDLSIIYSPLFDLTGLIRPVLSLNTNTDTQNGALIQYSTDGRFGEWKTLGQKESGIEWYNVEVEQDLQTIPGNLIGYGWKSDDDITPGWYESIHSLTDINTGRDNVVFRIIFKGRRGLPETKGFAFDNFRIFDRDRIVLLEHFENSVEVAEDGENLDEINAFGTGDDGLLNTAEIVKIQYRTGFGGEDEDYKQNRSDVNARALLYNINDANRAVMDGDFSEEGLFMDWGAPAFGTKSLTSPKLEFTNLVINQRETGEFDFDITIKANEFIPRFITHVAIVEQSTTGGLEYVMRKMVPDASGTRVQSLTTDKEIVLSTITWEEPVSTGTLSAVIFAQLEDADLSGKFTVLQTMITDISVNPDNLLTGITDLNEERKVNLYPNPASEQISVDFFSYEQKTVRVFDQFGRMVYDKNLEQGIKSLQIETDKLASGVYFLQIESVENELIREKFILSH